MEEQQPFASLESRTDIATLYPHFYDHRWKQKPRWTMKGEDLKWTMKAIAGTAAKGNWGRRSRWTMKVIAEKLGSPSHTSHVKIRKFTQLPRETKLKKKFRKNQRDWLIQSEHWIESTDGIEEEDDGLMGIKACHFEKTVRALIVFAKFHQSLCISACYRKTQF